MSAELPALSHSSRTTHHYFSHVRMLSAISYQFLSSGRPAHSSDVAMNYNEYE